MVNSSVFARAVFFSSWHTAILVLGQEFGAMRGFKMCALRKIRKTRNLKRNNCRIVQAASDLNVRAHE